MMNLNEDEEKFTKDSKTDKWNHSSIKEESSDIFFRDYKMKTEKEEFIHSDGQAKFYDNVCFLGWTRKKEGSDYKKRAERIIDKI